MTKSVAAVSTARTASTRSVVLMFSTSPLVSLVAFRSPARHVEDDRVALPALHELVLAQVSQERFLDKLDAPEFHERDVVLELPVQNHIHLPWTREHARVGDGHFVLQGIGCNQREPFRDVERVTVEITGA